MSFPTAPAISLVVAAVGSGLALVYARRAGIIDVPNPRSSHTIPTPRGGGIAIVAAVATAFALFIRPPASPTVFASLGLTLLALSAVGWLDDKGGVRVSIRLAVHIACGVAVAALAHSAARMTGWIVIPWLLWWVIWTAASINIVNFMDGIDGMIASQGIVYGVFLSALVPARTPGEQFGLVIAAASFGFLVWNWPPAKIFMGDVGSGPLGFFLVIAAALALPNAPTPLIFLPLFPLYLDALVTLLRRLGRGEPLTSAHKEHLYQRIANARGAHCSVTLAYAFAASVGAAVSIRMHGASSSIMWTAIAIYLGLVASAWFVANRWVNE